MEMAEILTNYLQLFVGTQEIATDWVCFLAGQYDLMVDYVPPPPDGGWPHELAAIQAKLLELRKLTSALAGAGIDALADKRLAVPEADRIQGLSRELRKLCYRLVRNACRAAVQPCSRGWRADVAAHHAHRFRYRRRGVASASAQQAMELAALALTDAVPGMIGEEALAERERSPL